MTLEELQNEVIRLQEENRELVNLREEVSNQNKRITELQEHNQKLFLKITHEEKGDEPEPEPIDIIEFAKTLKI